MLSLREVVSPTQPVLRQFAGLLVLFCGGLGLWQMLSTGPLWSKVLCGVGLVVGILGLIRTDLIKPLWIVWMIVLFPVAWVITHVLLAVLYFGLFTPIGLVLRMVRGDVLQHTIDRECESYWEPKAQPTSVKSYFRQF